VVYLVEQYLTGVFPRSPSEPVSKGPLRLVWCDHCHLVQLDHSFDATEMYGDNYGYRSGLNRSMVEHLQNKCQSLERMARLQSGDVVIDIGSNDGTLLRSYQTEGVRKVGVNPTAGTFRPSMFVRRSLLCLLLVKDPCFLSTLSLIKTLKAA